LVEWLFFLPIAHTRGIVAFPVAHAQKPLRTYVTVALLKADYTHRGGEIMEYIVEIRSYDYFAGNTRKATQFATLLEAWNSFINARKHDFDFGDHYRCTRIYGVKNDAVALKPQRPHARSAQEWEATNFVNEVAFADVRDIEPTNFIEDEYVFDNDSITF
jgi:hypothetical protein